MATKPPTSYRTIGVMFGLQATKKVWGLDDPTAGAAEFLNDLGEDHPQTDPTRRTHFQRKKYPLLNPNKIY